MASLAAGALLAAAPLTVQPSPAGPIFAPRFAHAKDGRDDRGGDDRGGRGGGSDDRGGDDRGGRGGSDDHGGRGGGSDDRGGDDRGGRRGSDDRGRGRGADDARADRNGDAEGGKVEITSTGVEVEHADGTKEEIRAGRYERKDASGRTVEERRATPQDFARLSGASSAPAGGQPIRVGFVSKVEAAGGNLEVLYSTGWKEEIENGRYELKDPNNNTVVERPARRSDIDRLRQLASR
jgi:hypothetical protein